ncbi:hypothetical protein Tco_1010982, partial [Tanacetum coccineum]
VAVDCRRSFLSCLDILITSFIHVSKRRAFWSLNEDILKITILKTNTPYPSRKIRRIRALTKDHRWIKLNTPYPERLNTPYSRNNRGDDEVELTDEESFDDMDEVAEVFRINTNLFDYETPMCKAFEELNYLLQIDPDLLTNDIKGFKTYEDYKND